tara:strand:- start:3453 stop:3698 length:246 start_codon:yes stop_codon:yes gene_type:complete
MNNLNSLNLVQLLEFAKQVKYCDPINEETQWTDNEVIYKAINISINSPIQIRAGLIMCDMFPPLKIIFKTIIRRYIKYYTQ